jgi:hypothetical protein
VHQRVPEVGVRAVGLVGQLAQLRVASRFASVIGSAGVFPPRNAFLSLAAHFGLCLKIPGLSAAQVL